MYYTNCVNILAAFLTPTVATIAAYIAYKQHKIEEERLKLSLFERRYAMFDATKEFISFILGEFLTDPNRNGWLEEKIGVLKRDTQGISFLFEREMIDYREELINKSLSLRIIIGGNPYREEILWEYFLNELIHLESRFEKYMKIYFANKMPIWNKIERANEKFIE